MHYTKLKLVSLVHGIFNTFSVQMDRAESRKSISTITTASFSHSLALLLRFSLHCGRLHQAANKDRLATEPTGDLVDIRLLFTRQWRPKEGGSLFLWSD